MCKSEILKKGLFSIREVLKRYQTLIPETQRSKYEKDLSMIFVNIDTTSDLNDLNKMEKLAKTKLKSIERIYGALREETQDDVNKSSLIDEETDNLFIKTFGIDPKQPIKSKFHELKNSPAFNPEVVKQYQEHYREERKRIEEAYKKVMQEKLDERIKNDQVSIENILLQGKDFDISRFRDKNGKLMVENIKDSVKNVLKSKGVENYEEKAENFDYTNIIKMMESDQKATEEHNQLVKDADMAKSAQEETYTDVSKSEQLFSVFSNNKNMSQEEYLKFYEKVKPILDDKSLDEDEKRNLYLKELKKHEEEWTMKNLDGVITFDKYGEFKFKFYKDEEKSNKTENSENQDNSNNESNFGKSNQEANSDSQKQSNGTKTYVWRDGKLVEGKAQERKVVTYSNWHSGNQNPDDMRKHRELLDRQHYGGPLWEGIKYVGNLSRGQSEVSIPGPTAEDLENLQKHQIAVPEKEGKKEIIEIVR
jgi:hypothetical protein